MRRCRQVYVLSAGKCNKFLLEVITHDLACGYLHTMMKSTGHCYRINLWLRNSYDYYQQVQYLYDMSLIPKSHSKHHYIVCRWGGPDRHDWVCKHQNSSISSTSSSVKLILRNIYKVFFLTDKITIICFM